MKLLLIKRMKLFLQTMRARILGATLIVILAGFGAFAFLAPATSEIQPYYSGDAISYRNRLIVASVNAGDVELFELRGKSLQLVSTISVRNLEGADRFYDVALSEEDSKLYVYAVNGRQLVKYNLAVLETPVLASAVKDSRGDWFLGVQRLNSYIATVGTQETKLWNIDLQVVNAYANPDKSTAVQLAADASVIADIQTDYKDNAQDDFVTLQDAQSRTAIGKFPIVFEKELLRSIYFATDRNYVYVAGDRVLKQVNARTGAVRNFSHTSTEGFSVDGIAGSSHFYFTDGLGVVKMNHDLQAVDWAFTKDMAVPGSWAMGLKAVMVGAAERVVVFNNTNIMVLDGALDTVAVYHAQEKKSGPGVTSDPLSLQVSPSREALGGRVALTGTGFGLNERVAVSLIHNGKKVGADQFVTADAQGRLTGAITVPTTFFSELPKWIEPVEPVNIEVRVTGLTSGLTYGTSFTVLP